MLGFMHRIAKVYVSLAAVAGIMLLATVATWVLASTVMDEPALAEYHSERWLFSLPVPADMRVEASEHSGGMETMQFLDASGDLRFQVTAVPYARLDLSQGMAIPLEPSPDQPEHLEIVDVVRDDLFVVLFQANGIRYAITSLPEDEPWLTEILTSWRFTH